MEDNIRSDKQLEKIKVVERLLELLGWQHARDETQLSNESIRGNFVERVVKDFLFKKQRCLNELSKNSVVSMSCSISKQLKILTRV